MPPEAGKVVADFGAVALVAQYAFGWLGLAKSIFVNYWPLLAFTGFAMRIVTEHDALTHAIIGCAMRVHSALGARFPEGIYQNALALDFERNALPFVREAHLPIYYLDTQIGARRVDFLVAEKVLVELKAGTLLGPDSFAQIINYLKAYKLEVDLLLNFGQASLTHKRFLRTIRPPDNP